MATESYLTPAEVAAHYNNRIGVKTLANWRCSRDAKNGPPYIRVGGRIMYPLSKLLAWEEGRCYTSTDEYGSSPRQ
jgi:hypothetical protein